MIGVGVDMLSDIILDVGVGILSDIIFEVVFDMLLDIEIIVMTTPVITFEFVLGAAYAVDVLADVLIVSIFDSVSATDVDMLVNENANGLAAVMPLEFTLPAP